MADFFDTHAELGSEEDDEDFDGDEEGNERPRRSNGANADDSSEEEEEDDEAELAAVREGFVVDEDDDEDDEESRKARRAERKKRKREAREAEQETLEDEDLDLIAEANPELAAVRQAEEPAAPRFKRLKMGRDSRAAPAEVDDFWGDENEETGRRLQDDEMEGFIEDDEPMDEDEREQRAADDEVRAAAMSGLQAVKDLAGLDEDALEDFQAAFGDGTEYEWALILQEKDERERHEGEDGNDVFKPMELKDVFEPSELERKYLTDADNEIRGKDEPERFQMGRKPYRNLVLTEEQVKEEAIWVAKLLWPKVGLEPHLLVSFQAAVAKALNCYNVDEMEVPFVYRHRKDYLGHEVQIPLEELEDGGPKTRAVRLLGESDLWEVFQLDLKFRAFVERRNTLELTYANAQISDPEMKDEIFEEMVRKAETVDELQDVQDYLQFQYSSGSAPTNGTSANGVGGRRRPGGNKFAFDRLRNSSVYALVKAFGISADSFAQNAARAFGGDSIAAKHYTEDPGELPEVMAERPDILSPPEFPNGQQCMRAARHMFAEELACSPRLRRVLRQKWYSSALIDCVRTDKGLKKIDEQHPYYEFKYLRNQKLFDIAAAPGLFLRMLRAEQEGFVEIRCRMDNPDNFKRELVRELESDNLSDVADAWNKERKEALSLAFDRISKIMARGIKENMKSECETIVAQRCRAAYYDKLDQAPWKPKGESLGTLARVLAISNGNGAFGRDPLTYVVVEDDGRMLESSRLTDLSLANNDKGIPDGPDVAKLIDIIGRHNPDVIAVSGHSTDTLKLFRQLQKIIEEKRIEGPEYTEGDDEDGDRHRDLIEILIVNDEVARLYKDSERASVEYPALTPLGRYCVALARYMQSPLHEYASLGRDILSINFDPDQRFLDENKLLNSLETAIVDAVNLVGVDINEAVSSQYHSNLLPYVAGLGPRKAQHLVKALRLNGGGIANRFDMIPQDEENPEKVMAVTAKTYNNCASFLKIPWDHEADEANADFLDATRIHPEDYELARKMAADALELDEEDIEQEQNEHGPSAVIRKMVRDGKEEKIEDLVLEEYARQLWEKFHQRKQGAINTIREELMGPYEELRRKFDHDLRTGEIFTMFTGETEDSLAEGMIVPIYIRKVGEDFIEGRLDCGIEATVEAGDISEDHTPARQLFAPMTTIRGKIMNIDKRKMHARMSVLERDLGTPYQKDLNRERDEWDERQEARDKEAMTTKNDVTGRTQRVIKHPLFRPSNAAQAEEYLGSQAVGSVVIRPSSKGSDHLVVTWKVSDGVYKHIDVLELDKENEFTVGRTLKIDGKYTYSDLDELIVNHVNAMARKVDEMMAAEKFQRGSKADTDRWLTTYLEANPKRSTYAFCINTKAPGYFHLCFKESQNQPVRDWPVKVVPGAFELQTQKYQDMRGLANGFKILYQNLQRQGRGGRR